GLPDNPCGSYSDPVLARSDRTGTIFLAILSRFNWPGDPRIVAQDHINIFRSIDNGVTFEAPVNSAPGFVPEVDENDKEWLAVDNYPGAGFGNVYMAWRDFSADPFNNGILFT